MATDAQLVNRIRWFSSRHQRREAENELILRHRPYVFALVSRLAPHIRTVNAAIEIDDLGQVGLIAMLSVARRHPPKGWDGRGKFVGYAKRVILGRMKDAIRDSLHPKRMNMTTGIVHELDQWHDDGGGNSPVESTDVSPFLNELTPEEATLISGVFGIDGTWRTDKLLASSEAVCRVLGLTRAEAKAMIESAMEKMRRLGYNSGQED